MEQYLLQAVGIFLLGTLFGVALILVLNKLRSGSVSPGKVRAEYQQYQEEVESHFEETSKKFKEMTEQYQDFYRHLSIGATSLCRPDSVAAALADESEPMRKPAQLEQVDEQPEPENKSPEPENKSPDPETKQSGLKNKQPEPIQTAESKTSKAGARDANQAAEAGKTNAGKGKAHKDNAGNNKTGQQKPNSS